jgi:hypothetical protein
MNTSPRTSRVAGRQVETFRYPAIELAHVAFFEGVAEAEHRHFVAHLGERRQRRAADALGRRVAGDQLGMGGFKGLEFMEQTIVFDVRNARLVQHVVTVVVLIQLSAQLENAGFGGGHGCSLIKQKSSRGCSIYFADRPAHGAGTTF